MAEIDDNRAPRTEYIGLASAENRTSQPLITGRWPPDIALFTARRSVSSGRGPHVVGVGPVSDR